MIAAAYTALTCFAGAFNLASGSIQIRVSEALAVLPYFTPAAVPGLAAGCVLSNILTGGVPCDVIFGSLATLTGAVGTYMLRGHKFLLTLPPVISNMLIIPFVLKYAYGAPPVIIRGIDASIPFFMATVGAGEAISCCLLGSMLLRALERYRGQIFGHTIQ